MATGSYEDDREIGRGGRWLSGRQMVIVIYGDKDKTMDLDLRPVDEDEDDDDEKREEIKFKVGFLLNFLIQKKCSLLNVLNYLVEHLFVIWLC